MEDKKRVAAVVLDINKFLYKYLKKKTLNKM